MKRRVAVAVVLAALALPGLQAQTRGVPASVTSFGFGGSKSFTPGPPASVTSLGPAGLGPAGISCGSGMLIPQAMGCTNPYFTSTIVNGQVRFGQQVNLQPPRRHRGAATVYVPYAYPVYSYPGYYSDYTEPAEPQPAQPPVTVQIVMPAQPPVQTASDEESRYGAHYLDQREQARRQPAPEAPPSEASAPSDMPLTVLVFKDGHRQEVRNYAIVGQTLYAMEGFTSHKILIALLDLKATVKVNQDLGLEFNLPASWKVD